MPDTVSLNLSVDSPHVAADTPPQAFYLLAHELSNTSSTSYLQVAQVCQLVFVFS